MQRCRKLTFFLENIADAKTVAAAAIALSDEHGFQRNAAGSRVSLAGSGGNRPRPPGDGMPIVNSGLDGLDESCNRVAVTLYLSWVAVPQFRW
jgi:hypothetical protein